MYNLAGRSLWLDEIVTARSAHLNSLEEVIAQSYFDVNQMPLFVVFTWLLRPWGDGEIILRLPAVVAGVLTVFAVYLLANSLFGTRAGLVSALLTAVLPYAVWQSQDARSYTLFTFLTTMQMYFAYRAVKRGRVVDWLGLAGFTTLDLYTHYLAFFPTAAAATYVGVLLLADVLSGTPRRVKASTISALAVIAGAAAFTPWRPLFREARLQAALSAVLLAAVLALGIVAAFIFRSKLLFVLRARRATFRQLALGSGAAVIVVVAYLPWIPQLRSFLNRPDASIGRLSLGHAASFGDVFAVVARLGFSGFLLAALCVGLGVVCFWMFRGRAAESGILVAWLGLSLLLFLRTAGSSILAIDIKYLAFLLPAAIIVLAAGIDGTVRAVEWAAGRVRPSRWSRSPIPAIAASVVLIALMLVQALPALAASYQAPKDDWRTAAQHIAASSPPNSVVLAVGDYSDWTVICLDYYFRRLHASVTTIDVRLVNSDVAATLASGKGAVWGVVIYPSAEQRDLLEAPGPEATQFVDITNHIHVVRASDQGLSAMEQASLLLHWEARVQASSDASAKLLDLYTGKAQLSGNLLPDPYVGGWSLQSGVRAEPAALSFAPTAVTGELNATVSAMVEPGETYLVSFEWRNAALHGSQRVLATAFDRRGHLRDAFPPGDGYQCGHSDTWTRSYFAFRAPTDATTAGLFLRVSGSGSAEFRNVQITRFSVTA